MNDLTLVYYTDNRLDENVAKKIRSYVLEVTENKYPVISVSQKPIDFGKNICLGEIGKSKYNLWKQVLIGTQAAKTKYVACLDDDTLYPPEHFLYRPPDDVIAYETNYWFSIPGERDYFWRLQERRRTGGQFGCISNRELLADNLAKRYEAYKSDPYLQPGYHDVAMRDRVHFGEPGLSWDRQFGIKNSKHGLFASKNPCVVFIHRSSMGFRGFTKEEIKKYGYPTIENTTVYLEQFGTPYDIYEKFWS